MKTTKHPLDPPPLEELAATFLPALQYNYAQASATVVQCPNLTQPPFHLASPGLCGNERTGDIGGQPHLSPRPLLDKKYSLLACAEAMEMSSKRGMFLGAGAGPFYDIGQNSELAPNLSWKNGFEQSDVRNLTHYTKINDPPNGGEAKVTCDRSPTTNCALMMNLFGSDGSPGPVLKITARSRKGEGGSFTEFLRNTLATTYGPDHHISMGGVVLLKTGKALFHVMPDFPSESELPFRGREHLVEWLRFRNFSAPMVCLTVFDSADPEGLGLRMEHTHCFSEDKDEGGHYHHDLLPGEDGAEEVEYEAYLNTAKVLYRVDQPKGAGKVEWSGEGDADEEG